MFSLIKNSIKNNWREILIVISAPLIAYIFNSFVNFVFKIGVLLGTFFRNLDICFYI